ncbi:MAG TPA: acyl-CoA desaturase [Polyangiaceae bacterium]|nr:acyl-CoA desaturase [Polyangiaceae bacterium]
MQSTQILVAPPVVEFAPPAAGRTRIDRVGSLPFIAVHVAAVAGVVMLGWSWSGFALAMGLYYLRMFGVTGGYHRYFSHRSYRTSRAFQFVLAVLAMTSVQKGVLWWASHHRLHHKMSDQPGDVHSVLHDGFMWSHVGWILSRDYQTTDNERVRDLEKFPELRFLNRWYFLPALGYGVLTFALGSWWGFVWGFLVSTTLLWHGTFTINSLSHMIGRRRYKTTDNSRNSLALALVTMGEGWHNNHHYYQRATNQGFYWWEIDLTYYVLRGLAAVGLVWDLHRPPQHVLDGNRIADG